MGWAAAAVLAAVVLALGVKLWLLRHGLKGLRLDLIKAPGAGHQHPAVPALPGQGIAAAGIIPQ